MSTSGGTTETTEGGSDDTIAARERTTGGDAPTRVRGIELGRGVEIDRYLVLHELGRGATGRVWAAYDGDLDRKVAIKIVGEPIGDDPERRKRLLGEAQAMAKIRHPNVVLVHDVGTFDGRLYIAMEFVEGTTLGKWWKSDPPPSFAARLDAMLAAARGLAAAHRVGLVHRDFKPDNVLVDRDHRIRVADFGLAQSIDRGASERPQGWSPAVGTPAYMSPEHHGLGTVDERSDQFSFCVALFECLAGTRPFAGSSVAELARTTVDGEIDTTAAAAIPLRLRRVILRGLAVRPADRYPAMDELIAALERARRPRWPWLLAVPALAGVAALAWVLARPTEIVDTCTAGTARAALEWTPEQRTKLRVGGLPTVARAAERRLADAIDAYATGWAALHDELCRADRDRDPSLAARRACVEDRFVGFQGLVVLATGRTLAPDAVDSLIATLPALADCSSDRPSAWEPVPADPELAAQVASIRARLHEVELRNSAGDVTRTVPELVALVDEARATGFVHVHASALMRLAWAEDDTGRTKAARARFDEALREAITNGHDFLAATVIAQMLVQMGKNPAIAGEAEHWATLGEALLARNGGDHRLQALVSAALGNVFFNRGEIDRALEQYHRVEAERVAMGSPVHEVAVGWLIQAAALAQLERADESWAKALRAYPILRDHYGTEHPQTIRALHTLGLAAEVRGQLDPAIAYTTDALARARRNGEQLARDTSTIAFNLAGMYARRGQPDAASDTLALSRAAWPVADDRFADAQYEEVEATIAWIRPDPARALQHIDRAIAGYIATIGDEQGVVARVRIVRADILVDLGRTREALAELDALWPKYAGWPFFTVVATDIGVVAAHATGDRMARALWLARSEGRPRTLADDAIRRRFVYAIVRGDRGPDALASLRRDRDLLVATTHPRSTLVRRIEGWIAGTWPSATTSAPR
ncbi:MAG TPA: protein kinase [Nannocystaceae bacterium]|nr:protein kinase [Nannocystaceae bacterium]